MSLKDATKKVGELFKGADDFSDRVTFDFGDEGKITVDGKEDPPKISNDEIDSDCTISISLQDFNEILEGDLDPQMAFMSGKLSVDGNMGIAMNLVSFLKS